MKLYRQLVVRLFKQADSQRFVLLFRRERMSAEMSLVWLTMSKALEGSIPMVSVQNEGQGWLKSWAVYYVQEGGGWKRWSVWYGSHGGWVKQEAC